MAVKNQQQTVALWTLIAVILCFLVLGFSLSQGAPGRPFLPPDLAKSNLILFLEKPAPTKDLTENLKWWPQIQKIYAANQYKPIWTDSFELNKSGKLLRGLIWETVADQNQDFDYHHQQIEKHASFIQAKIKQVLILDIILTDAYISFSQDALAGKFTPSTEDKPQPKNSKVHPDATELEENFSHQNALSLLLEHTDTSQLSEFLKSLAPQHPGYDQMRTALAHYMYLSSNYVWEPIPFDEPLQKSDRNIIIPSIRDRLILLKDHRKMLTQKPEIEEAQEVNLALPKYLFDTKLYLAVKSFQIRNGELPTGIIDKRTQKLLNVPIKNRVKQLALNMKRWRHLPSELGEKYIFVNMADYHLKVINKGKKDMEMRVIIGKPFRKTPIMSGDIRTIVLSPYWNVPRGIAVKDILPKVKKNPSYLHKKHIKVLTHKGKTVNTKNINWKKISSRNFPYRFRQDPGENNALGRIKFLFPNKHAVYLHDTPSRLLFSENKRAFSSGCIRVEKPIALAHYLLSQEYDISIEEIKHRIRLNKNKGFSLKNTIPVHLMYWTAWVNDKGSIQFREDIYHRDNYSTDQHSTNVAGL